MWVFLYLVFIIILMIATAMLTAHESSVIADMQFSKGPSKVGTGGLLQPMADAFKLLAKEHINISFLQEYLFGIAAWSSFAISMFFWFVVPVASEMLICNTEYSVFWTLNLSILHIYTMIIAGWASYSKYASLGSLSTTAQLVSYEVLMSVLYSYLFSLAKDLNFLSYVENQFKMGSFSFYLPALGVVFYMSSLAESGSHPFDLPEAEAELVAGYNVEYSAIWFALFFLGEYLNVIFNAVLFNDLFFGQSDSLFFFTVSVLVMVFMTMFISSLVPSYSYDQLMALNWKVLLPIFSSFVLYVLYLNDFMT